MGTTAVDLMIQGGIVTGLIIGAIYLVTWYNRKNKQK